MAKRAPSISAFVSGAETDETARVLRRYFLSVARGPDALMMSYAPTAVLITPIATYHGLKEISAFAHAFYQSANEQFWHAFKIDTQKVEGDVGYITWSAKPFVSLGTSTFVVRDGKIQTHTFTTI